MSQVLRCPLPAHAHLRARLAPGDFLDGYAVPCSLSAQKAAEIGLSMPRWADALLHLRNALVRPFGLKTETSNDPASPGAIFPVEQSTEDEVILGTDDRHLDFRICLMRHDGRMHMATWVRRHNLAGRAYLAAVMPFHVLIVRNAMTRIARSG